MTKRSAILGALLIIFVATSAHACWYRWYVRHQQRHQARMAALSGGGGGNGVSDPADDGSSDDPGDAANPDALVGESSDESGGTTYVSTTIQDLEDLDEDVDKITIGEDIREIKEILKRLEGLAKALGEANARP